MVSAIESPERAKKAKPEDVLRPETRVGARLRVALAPAVGSETNFRRDFFSLLGMSWSKATLLGAGASGGPGSVISCASNERRRGECETSGAIVGAGCGGARAVTVAGGDSGRGAGDLAQGIGCTSVRPASAVEDRTGVGACGVTAVVTFAA